VHSYEEFISLSGHEPITGTKAVYIQFFDTPNRTIDCNDYGSEFKWGEFTGNARLYGNCTYYIDLNGCTIKNFLIEDGKTMFFGEDQHEWNGSYTRIEISNGAIRNVFMGSATSKVCGDYVEFHDVSLSVNASGSTVVPFDGNGHIIIDNTALYLVASTLNTSLMKGARITDTDIELHIANQNEKNIFDATLTDCRIQGKISGKGMPTGLNADTCVLDHCGLNSKSLNYTNCVIDLDLTDSRIINYGFGGSRYDVFINYNGYDFNTNVICNSHHPNDTGHESFYGYQSDWNFISHTLMRNGAYLNSKGFTVVEVVEG